MKKRQLFSKAALERQRSQSARWRKLHPDYAKEWQAENRAYVTQQKREYRARKRRG
jgi:hypothetical protein